jgi:two-component sensor histidine kinase
MEPTLRQPNPESLQIQDPAAEAHHRIANSLTLLMSMVRMEAASIARRRNPPSANEVRGLLDGIGARINTIAHLHRLLSHVPFEGEAELHPHLKEVTDALVSALASSEQQVEVVHSGRGAMVRTCQVQPLVLILCEVFINAMKYAHPNSGQVILLVVCDRGPDGRLRVSVSDNGGGLPDGLDPRTANGLGFRVMRSLAAEVGAGLRFESSPQGFGVHLTLPARPN